MTYIYYPGCSLEGTAAEYDISTRRLFAVLGIELTDLANWTCCGATAAAATSRLLSMALPARNLALAERMSVRGDILAPCSACYLNLKKVERELHVEAGLLERINEVLSVEQLVLKGRLTVRHLLDVLVNDVPLADIAARRRRTFPNLRIVPYYGCQALRPYAVFDDPEAPVSMDMMIEATGAAVHSWNMGARCCGASLINTKPEVGVALVARLLMAARGADAIVTVCPMCQMNLEAYQKQASRIMREDLRVPILYLPQFLCLAMGVAEEDVRLDLNLSVTNAFRAKLADNRIDSSAGRTESHASAYAPSQ